MQSNEKSPAFKQFLFATIGAILGAALGVALTWFIYKQGVRAAAIPGGLLGIGAGWFRHRFIAIPVVCCIASFAVGVGVEWWLFPWADDESLGYFLKHLHEKNKFILVMLAIGGVAGFYCPYRSMFAANTGASSKP
jgi:hypothetical protein